MSRRRDDELDLLVVLDSFGPMEPHAASWKSNVLSDRRARAALRRLGRRGFVEPHGAAGFVRISAAGLAWLRSP